MNNLGTRLLFCCLVILLSAACDGKQEAALRTETPATAATGGDQLALPVPTGLPDTGPETAVMDPEAVQEAGLLAVEGTAASDDAGRHEYVATVNGENVPFAYLEQRLASMHSDQAEGRRGAYDIERLMFKVVNDVLLAQEARAVGMDQEEPIKGQVDRYREDLVVAGLEREQIHQKAKAGEDEIRRAFEEQYRRITLRVLTVDDKEEAEQLLGEIRAGADMAVLAAEHSVDPYASRGGIVEDIARRDLAAEVGALASTLEPGRLGGPVSTDLGYSVIRLESVMAADEEQFQAARPQLAGIVRLEKKKALRAALAERVQITHPVQMERSRIEAIEPQRLSDGRLVPRTGDRGDVVAMVGDSLAVTAGEYGDALLLRWSGVRSEDAARASAPIILGSMIEKKLLLAEAFAGGYAARPEVAERVRAYESQLLVNRYLEKVVAADIQVTAEEMQAAYEENRARLIKPPRLNLGQITVEEKALADEIAGLLREGTDLAWLARKHSTDRFAESGGIRGWMVPSPGVDDLQDRLFAAKPGEVLDPVGAPGNYYVLKVLVREEQGVYELADVSGNIRNMVFSEKFRVVLDEFMTTLRSRSEIRINEEALASISISGAVDDEPPVGEQGGAHAH